MNLEDFPGVVEMYQSAAKANNHYIPELRQVWQPSTELGIGLGKAALNTFYKNVSTTSGYVLSEYRQGICDPTFKQDRRLLETVLTQAEDVEDLYDEFERLAIIYISRNKQRMIFKENTFTRSMGTFGAIITINAPDWSSGFSPVAYLQSNFFEENMAYLSGNTVHVRGTKSSESLFCGGVFIDSDQYSRLASPKIHNGGGASFVCKTIED